jgi:hypothetical protein
VCCYLSKNSNDTILLKRIIVTLKDGNKIAGTYGENSFTSSHPSEEQIFLEETWVLNKEGRFERLRESTKGSIILFSNMVSLNCLKKINNTQG